MPRTTQSPLSEAVKSNPGPDEDKRSEAERANEVMRKRFYEERPSTGAEGIEESRHGNPD